MKTKTKSVFVLAFVLIVALISTVLALNVTKAYADDVTVTTFKMISGATVRAGGKQDDKNGITFAGEISIAEYEALSSPTAGMFFMPYDYVNRFGALNEQNCFSATPVYTWKTADNSYYNGDPRATATDETKPVSVLHVDCVPFRASSEMSADTVYRVQGSVVDILDKNLGLKYIGIAYIKAGDQYFFTQTDNNNSRSVVSVAQDVIVEGDETNKADVAREYLSDYLGSGKQVTINQEVYVNSSNGYTKIDDVDGIIDEELSSFTITADNDFQSLKTVIAPNVSMSGYQLAKGSSQGKAQAIPKIDDSEITFKYYFDKIVDDTVIFDGDTSKVTLDFDATNTPNALTVRDDWSYHGTDSIMVDDYFDRWATVKIKEPFDLPAPTTKISMTIRNGEYGGTGARQNDVEFYNGTTWAAGKFTVVGGAGDVYQVMIDLNKSVSRVEQISFCCDHRTYASSGGDKNPFYVDYVQAEYDLLSTGEGSKEFNVATQVNEQIEIDVLKGITSTVYADTELTSAQIDATYKDLSSADASAQQATVVDGKVSLTIPQDVNYQIECALTVGEQIVNKKYYAIGVYGAGTTLLADFDTIGDEGPNATYHGNGDVVDGVGIDGSKALKITNPADGWQGFSKDGGLSLQAGTYTFGVWIYSDSARTLNVATVENDALFETNYTESGASSSKWGYIVPTGSVTVATGWNYLEIEYTLANNSTINYFIFYTNKNSVTLDNITLK